MQLVIAILTIPVMLATGLISTVMETGRWVMAEFRDWRQSRRDRAEKALTAQELQLRRTILQLAEQLGAEAHEARKTLIRESFLASGRVPPPPR